MGMACGSIAPESFIFMKDYHHSQMFYREFGKFFLQIIPVMRYVINAPEEQKKIVTTYMYISWMAELAV